MLGKPASSKGPSSCDEPLRALTLALLASAIGVASAPQKADGPGAGDGELVSLRGCVSGSLLKSVRADPGTVRRLVRRRRAIATG